MKKLIAIISFAYIAVFNTSCNNPRVANEETTSNQPATDDELAAFISKIKAVDNHNHVNSVDPKDQDYDALPLEGLGNIELPVRVRPESPQWIAAAKAVYGFSAVELNEKAMKDLADTATNARKQKGEKFPEWALDQAGIEVMIANR